MGDGGRFPTRACDEFGRSSNFEPMKPLSLRLARIADQYGVRDVYVFGSRAGEISARIRRDQPVDRKSRSDVDIAVQPRSGHTLSAQDRVRLTIELEDLLDAPRVDLVVLSEARPFLAVEVIRGELLHTSDPLAPAEQELYVLRRAADLAPFRRERVRAVLTGGAR